MEATTKTTSPRQSYRQWQRNESGQYDAMNRCQKCNRFTGQLYNSTKYTDGGCDVHHGQPAACSFGAIFGDAGINLCDRCAELADALEVHAAFAWLTTETPDRRVVDCGLATGCDHPACSCRERERATQRKAATAVKVAARNATKAEKEAARLAKLKAAPRCGCKGRGCVGQRAHWEGPRDPYAPTDVCGQPATKASKGQRCGGCGDWCGTGWGN